MVPVLDIECSKKGTSEVHVYYKDGIINSDDLLTKTVMSIIILTADCLLSRAEV
jgi:hypothetical protein